MAKSKILKELANNEVSLDIALQRLILLASDLNDEKLSLWADKELAGYQKDDELPEYRKVWVGNVLLSGIKGNAYNRIEYKKMSVPLRSYIEDKERLSKICTIKMLEPIANIIQKANSPIDTNFSRSMMELNGLIWEHEEISCSAIEQPMQPPQFADIVAKLKQILLKIFIKLDKEYGNLDDLDIDMTNKPQKQIEGTMKEIRQIIYASGANVTINNTNLEGAAITNSNIQQGTTGSSQTSESIYNGVESIVVAIRKDIDTYGLDKGKKTELLKLTEQAEAMEKQKKSGKLKKVLLAIGGTLKDFAVGAAASLLANKIG